MTQETRVLITSQLPEKIISPELITEIKELAEFVLKQEEQKTGELSITLVTDDKIRELNHRYRSRDEITDVLSFPIDEELLGEIIIAAGQAKEQARDYGHSLKREISYLTVHGILHLLGYDHHEEAERNTMRNREEKILTEFGLGRE